MNTYAKYCPNVFVAKCTEPHEKGEVILVETKYGKENECEVHNLVAQNNGYFFYSITRVDWYDSQERARQKAERLVNCANHASEKSAAYFESAQAATAGIVPGQPILVGHYSEKYHRRALEKSDNAMRNSVELSKKAEDYERRAEYWQSRASQINLSMPESIEYYAFRVEQAEKAHQYLKEHPEARQHAYSLTYAKKDVNEARKNYELACKLWA